MGSHIVTALVALVLGFASAMLWSSFRAAAPAGGPGGGPAGAPPPPPVLVVQAQAASAQAIYRALGSVRAPGRVELRSQEDGRVVTVSFQDGDTVQAGQLLVQLDDTRERAQVAEAKADVDEARRQLRVNRELATTQVVSDDTVATYESRVAAAEARLRAAEASVDRLRIVAPAPGRVALRGVEPGDVIGRDQLVSVLVVEGVKRVRAAIPEQFLAQARQALGSSVSIRMVGGGKVQATVVYVAPEVDRATRTILVEAEAEDNEGLLVPGQSVEVSVAIERLEAAVVVPEEAVQWAGTQSRVWVVVEGKALPRPVQVGPRTVGGLAIASGLVGGETVVVRGVEKIFFPGAPVTAVPFAPPAPAAAPASASAAPEA